MMEKELEDILNDYETCSKFEECDECKANNFIPNTTTNWCTFLRERDRRLMDRIDKAFSS